ncbi:unnamed protein product [Spirodela intermedia]|uniref:Uncharacterized protein n=1 Tax=Spirodela intermedia TaxID=51605 RepID=A0A7I8LEE6_SPIIN|nr:unnamed protein product [Spirodela intermedia]
MDQNLKLGNVEDAAVGKEMYQCLVGRLIYLSHTQLDIAYEVCAISHFMHMPYYLKGTPRKNISVQKNGGLLLEAHTYPNYARSVVDGRSTSGYCTFLCGSLVM